MQLGKGDMSESVNGLRKLIQDLIAPELGSIKATQAAHGEQLALIRTEMKATEERSERNFQLVRTEMNATEERSEQNFQLIRAEMKAAEERSEQNFQLVRTEMKATEERSEQNFQLIRAEMKAAEERSEQNFQLVRTEMKATEERERADQKDLEVKLIDRIEFARSEAQHSTNEIKLLIGLNYEQRKREEAEARVAELERRLQLQPPS